jgi:hypothetical protein
MLLSWYYESQLMAKKPLPHTVTRRDERSGCFADGYALGVSPAVASQSGSGASSVVKASDENSTIKHWLILCRGRVLSIREQLNSN